MKILALYSNKGGVGKTAATVNLSYLAAQAGIKTLVCDLDSQGASTYYFRIKAKLRSGARGLSKRGRAIEKSIKGTDYDNLDLLPADVSHRNLDLVFHQLKQSKRRLGKVINPLKKEYDLIVLDCPPTINLLSENVFNVAEVILVPLIPTTLSGRSYRQLRSFFTKKNYDHAKISGFISMMDQRKKLHRELAQTMQAEFEGMLQQAIPTSADVERMGVYREPVFAFAPRSTAAIAYHRLWAEIAPRLA